MTWIPDRSGRFPAPGVLAVAFFLAWPKPAGAQTRAFVIDPRNSRVVIHVGKAGLFKFAGHEHEVVAPLLEGEILADASDLTRSSVRLAFEAAALRVEAGDEPPEDVPKVQEAMAGPHVLDVGRFTRITFRSEKVSGHETTGGAFELVVSGPLELHGQEVSLTLSVRAELKGDDLQATGKAVLRQSAFGINPVSVGGVVKVKDELGVDFQFAARPRP